MDVLLLSVTDAKSTVLLSTYQTRLVCAIPILDVPWLKPYNNDSLPHVYAAATCVSLPLKYHGDVISRTYTLYSLALRLCMCYCPTWLSPSWR